MFSIKESIKYGWEKTKANFWKVVGLVVISMIPSFIVSVLDGMRKEMDSPAYIALLVLLSIAVQIISIVITIGLMKIFLRIHDGENPSWKEILSAHGVFWKYLGTVILYMLIVLGGFILLVVPGIIWAIKYNFAPLIVVDTGSRPVAAIKESGRITDGSKWKLLGFWLVTVLIVIAGYVLLFVGSLVAIPLVGLAWIHVYRTLSQAKAGIAPVPSPQPAS